MWAAEEMFQVDGSSICERTRCRVMGKKASDKLSSVREPRHQKRSSSRGSSASANAILS